MAMIRAGGRTVNELRKKWATLADLESDRAHETFRAGAPRPLGLDMLPSMAVGVGVGPEDDDPPDSEPPDSEATLADPASHAPAPPDSATGPDPSLRDRAPGPAKGSALPAAQAPGYNSQPSALAARDVTTNFSIIKEIARGGMGVVYHGRQRSLRRDIAIKRSLTKLRSAETRRKFVAEARATAFLDHPNIVPVHEIGIDAEGEILLAMKLVDGKSWGDLLQRREGRPVADLDAQLEVLLGVCNAIAFAHSRGLTHLDLKPDNVMVGPFGEVLVMDWGTAVDISDPPVNKRFAPHKRKIDMPMGTPVYMAPELAKGEGAKIGPPTDVFLLGAMLYELLCGVPPFRSKSVWAAVAMASLGKYAPLPRSAPRGLRKICEKALALEPEDRYPSVEAFVADLRRFRKTRDSAGFLFASTVFVSALAVLALFTLLLVANEQQLAEAQRVRFTSYRVARDLERSSDDLSARARRFVVTGDPVEERAYEHILAVRNGEAPGPDGESVALLERMRRLGFSAEELALLEESERRSNALVATERFAMAAVKGLSEDSTGALTVRGEPRPEEARERMFDVAYEARKRSIDEPIGQFLRAIDDRTNEAVERYAARSRHWLGLILGTLAALLVAALVLTLRTWLRLRRG